MNEDEMMKAIVEEKPTAEPTVWDKVKGGLKKTKDNIVEFVYDHDEEIAWVGLGMCAGLFSLTIGHAMGYCRGINDGLTAGHKSSEAYFELGKIAGKAETLESIVSGDLEGNKF